MKRRRWPWILLGLLSLEGVAYRTTTYIGCGRTPSMECELRFLDRSGKPVPGLRLHVEAEDGRRLADDGPVVEYGRMALVTTAAGDVDFLVREWPHGSAGTLVLFVVPVRWDRTTVFLRAYRNREAVYTTTLVDLLDLVQAGRPFRTEIRIDP